MDINKTNSNKISVNKTNYHVEIRGKGEAVLILHGFTGSSKSFEELIDCWSSQYQVIAVDILGHSKKEKPSDYRRYEMDKIVEDLKKILEKLEALSGKVEEMHSF